MIVVRALALSLAVLLAAPLDVTLVSAQSESASAEDGKSVEDAPATTPAPTVPIGANLTPPLGITPPGPAIVTPPGSGQPGSSSVSMAPGTQSTGIAREGRNAARAPEAAPDSAATSACGDYPTWYDAQLALESAIDEATLAALDPDGDAIACEELMY